MLENDAARSGYRTIVKQRRWHGSLVNRILRLTISSVFLRARRRWRGQSNGRRRRVSVALGLRWDRRRLWSVVLNMAREEMGNRAGDVTDWIHRIKSSVSPCASLILSDLVPVTTSLVQAVFPYRFGLRCTEETPRTSSIGYCMSEIDESLLLALSLQSGRWHDELVGILVREYSVSMLDACVV